MCCLYMYRCVSLKKTTCFKCSHEDVCRAAPMHVTSGSTTNQVTNILSRFDYCGGKDENQKKKKRSAWLYRFEKLTSLAVALWDGWLVSFSSVVNKHGGGMIWGGENELCVSNDHRVYGQPAGTNLYAVISAASKTHWHYCPTVVILFMKYGGRCIAVDKQTDLVGLSVTLTSQ